MVSIWSTSIAITVIAMASTVNVKSCPFVCSCKKEEGRKRKVECVNKNLTSLLTGIDSDTQILNYSKNYLPLLRHHFFDEVNLINLHKLNLSHCHIIEIQNTAFYALANLIELDLSSNTLISITSNSFSECSSLMKLIFSDNPIRVLDADAFSPLQNLDTLDLSSCQIESIDQNAFGGLQKLNWLKLDNNRLTNLKFAQTMPQVISGLSLHQNPWKCDCFLRSLYTWVINTAMGTPLIEDPVCDAPMKYQGMPIAQLTYSDLACAPNVSLPLSSIIKVEHGKNISFVCQVNAAVPMAKITWDFEGNPINCSSCLIENFYEIYAENEITQQGSELFIVDAKKENEGTYQCTAVNTVGRSTSNFILTVINAQSKEMQSAVVTVAIFRSFVPSLIGISLFIVLIVLIVTIFLSCLRKSKLMASSEPGKSECRRVRWVVDHEVIELDDDVSDTLHLCKEENHVKNADIE